MFRFTIRELVLLTVIVALAVGWACNRWSIGRRLSELEFEQRMAAEVRSKLTYELVTRGNVVTVNGDQVLVRPDPATPSRP